jgi:hypothetical protein
MVIASGITPGQRFGFFTLKKCSVKSSPVFKFRPADPGVLPSERNVLVISALPDIGTVAITALAI